MNFGRICSIQPLSALAWAAVALSPAAAGQCFEWQGGFVQAGLVGYANDQVVHDDGSGAELFVGGSLQAAGELPAQSIAKWNGARWAPIPSALTISSSTPTVYALAVFDDGAGPALYAGGLFTKIDGVTVNYVAKWNGANWSSLAGGVNNQVLDLAVFDDGSGDALYACGTFGLASGTVVHGIAKWNGSSWSSITSSLTHAQSAYIRRLAVADDGSGPALFASGRFTNVDGVNANYIAKWNGSTWSALGSGLFEEAYALAAWDDGSGPALFVGGGFSSVGGVAHTNRIAKWRNGVWSPLGLGVTQYVYGLGVYDDGNGAQLYVAGQLTTVNGAIYDYGLARWNGSAWSKPTNGNGLDCNTCSSGATTTSLAVYDDGSGPGLYVTGVIDTADGQPATHIARFDGGGWAPLGTSNAPSGTVGALHTFDDGSGSALYVGGNFQSAGGALADSIAKFDGASWSIVGNGFNCNGEVSALADFDDGSGPALYAGGSFTEIDGVVAKRIAKFDGTSWSALGTGINAPADAQVNALLVHDDGSGPALIVAGKFTTAGGGSAKRIARWDGTTWSTLGTGFDVQVNALAVFDDGGGPELYAGGNFQHADGNVALGIAKWDGASWSVVGFGTNDSVTALGVFDDGSGPALYVGGAFSTAGGVAAVHLAKWNGVSWSTVGGSVFGTPYAFEIFDDGAGAALYMAGSIASAAGVPVQRIARWNGSQWSALDGGIAGTSSSSVLALGTFDDGTGAALFAGGGFTTAGAHVSVNIAKWSRSCACPPVSYCTSGTSSNGCVPSIGAVGTPSASGSGSFVVTANNVEGQKLGLLFYGMSGATSSPWGASTSTLCVKPPQQRTGQMNSGGTSGACDGAFVLDFNAYVGAHPSSLGQPFSVGDIVRMQGWYRDPPNPKTTSLTNALEFYLCP